jgi:hypothetical protein
MGNKSNNRNVLAETRFQSIPPRTRHRDRIAETRLGREEGQGNGEEKEKTEKPEGGHCEMGLKTDS